MKLHIVPARTGVDWVRQGIRVFWRQPLALTLLFFTTTAAMSLLSVLPLTGRTHQIRVHFSAIGHPLAGEALYGGATALITRPALHSVRVTLTQPVT